MFPLSDNQKKKIALLIEGDAWFDFETRTTYSTATCLYKVMPLGVVAPKHAEDVSRIVRFCNKEGIALIPRGGATGLVGQALGMGIILDFTKYMNAIVKIADDLSTITTQPGCITATLNQTLAPHKKYYPIDPQSAKKCTIGGNIATNAAGPHGIKYGATKNEIRSATVVLSNGDAAQLFNNESNNILSPFGTSIVERTKNLLKHNQLLIQANVPKAVKFSSGYNIYEALRNDNLNMLRLLCGSEGTLAVVTEATFNMYDVPTESATFIAYFDSYEKTAEATLLALEFSPDAIELLDKSYAEVGTGINETIDSFLGGEFQAMLAIQFEGQSKETVQSSAENLLAVLKKKNLMLRHRQLFSHEEQNAVWELREEVAAKLNTMPSVLRKTSIIEDGAVPVAQLAKYLSGVQRILTSYNIPFRLYGHAGTGNIHCSTYVAIETHEGQEKIECAARDVFDLTIQLGGTLSGEHGDGYIRTPFLERAVGTDIYAIFKDVKNIFDPNNILNPNKIIGKQDGFFLHDIKYV